MANPFGEHFDQIRPSELRKILNLKPWSMKSRGNGHIDLYDATGTYFAHVFCWDDKDWEELDEASK